MVRTFPIITSGTPTARRKHWRPLKTPSARDREQEEQAQNMSPIKSLQKSTRILFWWLTVKLATIVWSDVTKPFKRLQNRSRFLNQFATSSALATEKSTCQWHAPSPVSVIIKFSPSEGTSLLRQWFNILLKITKFWIVWSKLRWKTLKPSMTWSKVWSSRSTWASQETFHSKINWWQWRTES